MPSRIVKFGCFQADLESGELYRDGIRLKLGSQPFQVLEQMVARPGEVVTREQLRTALWPSDTFVDFDHGLNTAINKIREVLGDSASNPRFVETIPRRGYRFIVPVERPVIVHETPSPPRVEPVVSAPAATPAKQWTKPGWRIAAAGLLAIVGLGALYWRTRLPPPRPELKLQQLTADAGCTIFPDLSPDGKFAVYASDRAEPGNLDIWVHPLAPGTQPRRLTNHPAQEISPSISPDGAQVVFHSSREGGGIYVIPTFGGEERLVVRGGSSPRFSPDGKWILYAITSGWGDSKVFVIPAVGGASRQLAKDLGRVFNPEWSADGKSIMVKDSHNLPWICALDTGPCRQTATEGIGRYAWLPDRILFSKGNLWEIPLSSGVAVGPARQITKITENVFAPRARVINGKTRLIFSSTHFARHLLSLPLDSMTGKAGGRPEPLPHSGGSQFAPGSSVDGARLVFVQEDPPRST
jgi:DNA-binding winged helix-turn-helix (wHTH) protein